MTKLTNGRSAIAANPKKGFKIHLLVFALSIPVTWLVWLLTGSGYPWPLWSTPAWGTGVLFHYLGVFKFSKRQPSTL